MASIRVNSVFCLLLALGSLRIAAIASSTPPAGLCHSRETTYFQCETASKKFIALCATSAGLQYRFGTHSRIELQFPEPPNNAAFQMARYSRFNVERVEVTFSNGGARYAVFDYSEDGRRESGVQVTTLDDREMRLTCRKRPVVQLQRLKGLIACDADHAFSAGGSCR